MKGEKFNLKQESSIKDKMNYSPSMSNLEKVVMLGLAGHNLSNSQAIANLKYLKECSAVEFLDIVKKAVQKGRNFKNLNEYSLVILN